jgi:acetate kinase
VKILVFNCGSSTLKFQLIELSVTSDRNGEQKKLARGIVEHIGDASSLRFEAFGGPAKQGSVPIRGHNEAVVKVIEWLSSDPALRAFDAVGHRVVHGGDQFTTAVRIDDRVIETLESLCEIAPLHNPASVSGVRAARAVLGAALPMVAAFDTSFHSTLADYASTYAIPYDLSLKHRIRRYGFHGIAHQYSVLRYGEICRTVEDQINIVTLHLGNGCSACAIRGGKSVDTSMGFTPLEGLVMGTRSGDLDPALVSYLADQEGVDALEVESWLNKRSGLLGISGVSNDMRKLVSAYETNPRARLAVDVFCYRGRKYLGAYLAALNGADAVIFSGGIGENLPFVREQICAGMEWCGLILDQDKNSSTTGVEGRISGPRSRVQVYVIPSDEEALIARETARLLQEEVS